MRLEKVAHADVGIDRSMRIIVEIFPVGVVVIGLQNVDGSILSERGPELLQHQAEILLRDVLKEIAGEHEVY